MRVCTTERGWQCIKGKHSEMEVVKERRGETYSMPSPDTKLTTLKRRAMAPQQRSQVIRKSSCLLPGGERPLMAFKQRREPVIVVVDALRPCISCRIPRRSRLLAAIRSTSLGKSEAQMSFVGRRLKKKSSHRDDVNSRCIHT